MIENDQLRQCVVEINRQLERLLLIHRQPTQKPPEITDNDGESFETRSSFLSLQKFLHLFFVELMNLPCEAVNEIVQRHFAQLYDQIDHYMLHHVT